MALNLNKVFEAGNISTDLELKVTQSGKKTVSFNIAVNKYTKGGENKVNFFTVVAWELTAEFICRHFKKGSPIFIEGSLENESWTDKQGNKRITTKIIASDAKFVVSKNDAEASPSTFGNYIPDAYKPSGKSESSSSFETITSDDQLPF